jgi:hypothetical protein
MLMKEPMKPSSSERCSRVSRMCETCDTVMSRYIHNNKHWCRECLDKEQYPQLAHLTQEEREQVRADTLKNVKNRGFLNTGTRN